MRPVLLDLCCCAGGAAVGYDRAGFTVLGVDVEPQPNYPFPFYCGDGLEVLRSLIAGHGVFFTTKTGESVALFLDDIAVIHVSAPCQRYTIAANQNPDVEHPDLVDDFRLLVMATGKPYVLENVQGAPLLDALMLCGSEFGLRASDVDGQTVQLRRHRKFESNVWLMGAGGCQHDSSIPYASVYGYGGASGPAYRDRPRGKGYVPHLDVCAQLLGIDWMSKRELSESIPPAYTEWIGRQLLEAVR